MVNREVYSETDNQIQQKVRNNMKIITHEETKRIKREYKRKNNKK